MIFLKITDKKKSIKFKTSGNKLYETYEGYFEEGDEIYIHLDGVQTLAVKLDESLQESLIYCPNKSFTFTIPTARELQMGYASNAFQGEKHLIWVREVEDDEFYAKRNIASEYGQYNIQCNGIGPGYIATPQTAPLRE